MWTNARFKIDLFLIWNKLATEDESVKLIDLLDDDQLQKKIKFK